MNDFQDLTDRRILLCPLPLTSKSEETDRKNAAALIHATPWFTDVVLMTGPWQTVPDATTHPIIKLAMQACATSGLSVIWGRWMWVGWPSDKLEAPMPGDMCQYDPEYYAAFIANLNREARFLGADRTAADVEPNGIPANEGLLKTGGPQERKLIQRAIRHAVRVVGQVDIVMPSASANKEHFAWATVDMGRDRWGNKAHYARTPDEVIANPPDGVTHKMDIWVSFATTKSRAVGSPQNMTLTPTEVQAIDMEAVRKLRPSIRGQGVYIPDKEFVEVLKGWNG